MKPLVNFRDIEFADPNYVDLSLDGILGLPEIESHDLAFSTRSGLMPGEDFLRGRTITFAGTVLGDDDATFGTNIENLRYAFEPREFERDLFITVPGLAGGNQVGIGVRPRRGSLAINVDYVARAASFTVDLFATDPYYYAAVDNEGDLQSVVIFLNSVTTGHGFDHGFDLGFGGGSTSTVVTNTGNALTYPIIVFNGPLVNPKIVNQAAPSGTALSFNISLGVGEFLTVDTKLKQVMLNGTVNRYDTINDSDWFGIYPGNNTIIFTVASTTGVPTVVMSWRNAWL